MSSFACRTLIALLLSCVIGGQTWATPSPHPVPADAIVSESDCFSMGSYDDWMAGLREKNGLLKYLLIRWKFPEDEFTRYQRDLDCRAITYRSDQHLVHGWIVRPKHRAAGGKRPVILYNRGGNRGYGALTFANLFTHVFPLAESGYLVAASQYRGVTTAQDAATSPDQFGGDDVRDVTNLLRIVSGLPDADPDNLFMVGQSRGAIMTFRALLETPLPIRAVAIYSGVYDLYDLLEIGPTTGTHCLASCSTARACKAVTTTRSAVRSASVCAGRRLRSWLCLQWYRCGHPRRALGPLQGHRCLAAGGHPPAIGSAIIAA